MRKSVLLIAFAAVAMMTSGALAQTTNGLALFFDVRNTASADPLEGGGSLGNTQWSAPVSPWMNEPNGGGKGDGQTLYVSPTNPLGNHVGFTGYMWHVQRAYLYADVEARGVEDVITSIGLDMPLVKTSGAGTHSLASVGFADYSLPADVGGGLVNDAWDGTSVGTVDLGGVIDWRAVQVPVNGVPMYDATQGLGPGGTYRLAELEFTGGPCASSGGAGIDQGLYNITLEVGGLLITRSYGDGAGGIGVGPTPEVPDFGYAGGAPEALNEVGGCGAPTVDPSGECAGSSTTNADLLVVVAPKGDYDDDGITAISDLGTPALPGTMAGTMFLGGAGVDVHDRWMGDFDGDNFAAIADLGTPGLVGTFAHSMFNWAAGCP